MSELLTNTCFMHVNNLHLGKDRNTHTRVLAHPGDRGQRAVWQQPLSFPMGPVTLKG